MPGKEALHKLLNLNADKAAPSFIIYAAQPAERLNYTCEFIFKHVLKSDFKITHNLNDFENPDAYKINYSKQVISNSLQVIPQGLLFEKGTTAIKPEAVIKNGSLYFYYHNSGIDALDFDVFSAVFYFISRYEEWQPFQQDAHGRFEANESILFKNNFHLKPVADLWIYELKASLEKKFTELVFPAAEFKIVSTIDVDNLYAYKAKGLIRTIGAGVKDLLKLDLKNLAERINVLAGSKKDPFDIYETVSEFCADLQIPLIYFFLFKSGTKYDRTVDPASGAFGNVFSILKNKKALAGLHPSYNAAFENGLLKKEAGDFSKQYGEPVKLSRQHFLRFDIKTTPQLLLQQGIIADFSMGFASSPGFRAGTSQPFYYYDFATEKQTDLLFVPFCAMDGAYFIYDKIKPEAAFQSLYALAAEVKKVNGLFITVFHERTFSNSLYNGFGALYKSLHLELKKL